MILECFSLSGMSVDSVHIGKGNIFSSGTSTTASSTVVVESEREKKAKGEKNNLTRMIIINNPGE